MLRKFCEHTYGQSLWFRHVVFFGKTFCTICRETFSLWFANLSLVLKGLQSLIRTGEGKQGQMQKGARVKCTAYLHRYQFPTFYSVQFERVSLAIALRERPESSKRCLHTRGRRQNCFDKTICIAGVSHSYRIRPTRGQQERRARVSHQMVLCPAARPFVLLIFLSKKQ